MTDLVACVSLKTPTAVADYIIEKNMMYESRIESFSTSLTSKARTLVKEKQQTLSLYKDRLALKVDRLIQEEINSLDILGHRLNSDLGLMLQRNKNFLDQSSLRLDSIDPIMILNQGYSIIRKDGKSLSSSEGLKVDDEVTITMHDGQVESIISKV